METRLSNKFDLNRRVGQHFGKNSFFLSTNHSSTAFYYWLVLTLCRNCFLQPRWQRLVELECQIILKRSPKPTGPISVIISSTLHVEYHHKSNILSARTNTRNLIGILLRDIYIYLITDKYTIRINDESNYAAISTLFFNSEVRSK